MSATWPAFLQEKVNQAGFGYEPGNTIIRSDMGSGPAKTRAVTTSRVDTFTVSILLENSDFADWDNFYTTTLNNGVNTFYYNHPFTQVQSIFRMNSVKIDPVGGVTSRISMTWELMP